MSLETESIEGNGEAERGTVVKDRKLVALNRITTILNRLSDDERVRVLSYIYDEYESLIEKE